MNYYALGSDLPQSISDLITVSAKSGMAYANQYQSAQSVLRSARTAVQQAEARQEMARIQQAAAVEYAREVAGKGRNLDKYSLYALGGGLLLVVGVLVWPRKR